MRVDVRQKGIARAVAGLDEDGEDGEEDEEDARRGRVEKADEEGECAAADGEEADPDCGRDTESAYARARERRAERERRGRTLLGNEPALLAEAAVQYVAHEPTERPRDEVEETY